MTETHTQVLTGKKKSAVLLTVILKFMVIKNDLFFPPPSLPLFSLSPFLLVLCYQICCHSDCLDEEAKNGSRRPSQHETLLQPCILKKKEKFLLFLLLSTLLQLFCFLFICLSPLSVFHICLIEELCDRPKLGQNYPSVSSVCTPGNEWQSRYTANPSKLLQKTAG